jgi:hypothetical protein
MLPRVSRLLPSLTRRSVLLGGSALAAVPLLGTGCTRHKAHVPTPRENLLDETLALEDTLLTTYEAAAATVDPRSKLGQALIVIRNAHAAHRATLLTAGAQPAPGTTPSPTPTPTPIPLRDVARVLAATETAAATIRLDTCVRAPGDLAPLLGSLAASESAHAALLREAR